MGKQAQTKENKNKKAKDTLSNPHDLLVKATLSHPQALQEFAEAYFPSEVLKQIDKTSLQLTNKSYVSDELKEFHNDLVFSFTIKNQPGFAYTLLEHQSSPNFRMPLRFIKYIIALLEDVIKDKDGKTPLPIIIPICLYHNPDRKPYPYTTSIYDMFVDPDLARSIGIFDHFKLGDLNSISDEILDQHGSINLMEKLLKYSRDRDAFNILEEELEKNKGWLILRGRYWASILIYSLYVIGKKKDFEEKVLNLFKEKLNLNEEDIMQTIAHSIEKRGEVRGERRGMKMGIQNRNVEIAKNMLKDGESIEKIIKWSGLDKVTIKKLQKDLS